jgi:hypothetical protein
MSSHSCPGLRLRGVALKVFEPQRGEQRDRPAFSFTGWIAETPPRFARTLPALVAEPIHDRA